jgi:hypothetical protein
LASYSDEFNSGSTTLAGRGWTDGNPTAYSSLSINTTVSGKLMIIPNSNVVWYYDLRGVFIYKQISGNFVARSYVRAGRVGSVTATEGPTKDYNSIGLIAYNPSSTAGNRNWVVNNLGYQHPATGVGSEAKTTKTSVSNYYLKNGVNSGLIVMCRIGANFYMYRKLDGESSWTKNTVSAFQPEGGPSGWPTDPESMDRSDLNLSSSSPLYVGIMSNGYDPASDLQGEMDYIRFAVPTTESDCTADIAAAS